MTGSVRLALLLTGLISFSAHAQEPSLLLRYYFEPETTRIVTVTADNEVNLGGVILREARGQVMLMSPIPNPTGGTSLIYEIKRQTLQMTSEGIEVNFDSSNIETPTTRERLSQLSESVGNIFHLTVDDRGQVLSRGDVDVLRSMVEMSLQTMPTFAEEGVAVGEGWGAVSLVRIGGSGDQLLVSRQYYLESSIDGVAVVTYDMAIAASVAGPESASMSAPLNNAPPLALVGTGRFIFDLQRGQLVSLSESTHVDGAFNGSAVSVSTSWEVVIE